MKLEGVSKIYRNKVFEPIHYGLWSNKKYEAVEYCWDQ